ncbi:hypothetical protein H5410_059833 [Solanum commersonii]|uniref:Uncharacterized protein n=1 Tax=Solanum commersonii TaxID=4109 RepID=A0A9J5W3F7_SOLCO|nr:hypothetical protein H5410_059833 [Solanum commersonii]
MEMESGFNQETRTGAFFMATLLIWAFSVLWEILINKRKELFPIVLGFIFYQSANWVILKLLQNRDPHICQYLCISPPFIHYICFSALHFGQSVDDFKWGKCK